MQKFKNIFLITIYIAIIIVMIASIITAVHNPENLNTLAYNIIASIGSLAFIHWFLKEI